MEWQQKNSTTYYSETKHLNLTLTIDRIVGKVTASLTCGYAIIPRTGLTYSGDPSGLRRLAKNEYKDFTSFIKAKNWIEHRAIKKEKNFEKQSIKHFNMVNRKTEQINMKENNRIRAAKNRLSKIYIEAESTMR